MAKKQQYQYTRIPFDEKKGLQTTRRSKLDTGSLNDLREKDDFFDNFFKENKEKLKAIGLNSDSVTIKIELA